MGAGKPIYEPLITAKVDLASMVAIQPRGGPEMELRRFFGEYESSIGICSSFGAALVRWGGGSSSTNPDDHGVRGVECGVTPSLNVRVWRALKRMDDQGLQRALIVLHRLYGSVRCTASATLRKELGVDLARLATMTEAAERAREDLACDRGLERESGVRLHCVKPVAKLTEKEQEITAEWERLARRRADLVAAREAAPDARLDQRRQRLQEKLDEGTVLDEAREKLKARLKAVEARCQDAGARSGRRQAKIAQVDAEIEQCARALDLLGSIAARAETAAVTSTYASADAETTYDEAIDWRLRQKEGREEWLSTLGWECRDLRTSALQAYRVARAFT